MTSPELVQHIIDSLSKIPVKIVQLPSVEKLPYAEAGTPTWMIVINIFIALVATGGLLNWVIKQYINLKKFKVESALTQKFENSKHEKCGAYLC